MAIHANGYDFRLISISPQETFQAAAQTKIIVSFRRMQIVAPF